MAFASEVERIIHLAPALSMLNMAILARCARDREIRRDYQFVDFSSLSDRDREQLQAYRDSVMRTTVRYAYYGNPSGWLYFSAQLFWFVLRRPMTLLWVLLALPYLVFVAFIEVATVTAESISYGVRAFVGGRLKPASRPRLTAPPAPRLARHLSSAEAKSVLRDEAERDIKPALAALRDGIGARTRFRSRFV